MHAVRNIKLCTKDCLCLYVCPTGATDTETGQIDAQKCLDGCRVCVDACPSHAISLMPEVFPKQQVKTARVKHTLYDLAQSKVKQESIAKYIQENSDDPVLRHLCKALVKSNRLMAEDVLRESGYMLPQGKEVQALLHQLLDKASDDFPVESVQRLLVLLNQDALSATE